jgi:phage/plasmid-like protein (TIGR03299 family)
MAHEIESLFYVGEVPWHGLGKFLPDAPSVEDAIVCAGLDWEVQRKQLVIGETGAEVKAFANVRSTDSSVLGIVGPGYRPLQNKDAFGWFQPFIEDGSAVLETAGSLRKGKHVWILARIKRDPIEIVKGDPVQAYILLSNSHDGTSSIQAGYTGIRTVCANTVAAALSAADSKLVKLRHSKSAADALEQLRETMVVADREFVATTDVMKAMARKGVSVESLKKYIRVVFEPKMTLDSEEEIEEKMKRTYAKVIPLFEKGRGNDLPGVNGTLWGAYNAVTEYLTWERGRSNDTRLESLWMGGEGAKIAQRALTEAMRIAA